MQVQTNGPIAQKKELRNRLPQGRSLIYVKVEPQISRESLNTETLHRGKISMQRERNLDLYQTQHTEVKNKDLLVKDKLIQLIEEGSGIGRTQINLKSTNNKAKKEFDHIRVKNFCSRVTLDCTHSHMTFWGESQLYQGTIHRELFQINRNQEEPRWKKGQSI